MKQGQTSRVRSALLASVRPSRDTCMRRALLRGLPCWSVSFRTCAAMECGFSSSHPGFVLSSMSPFMMLFRRSKSSRPWTASCMPTAPPLAVLAFPGKSSLPSLCHNTFLRDKQRLAQPHAGLLVVCCTSSGPSYIGKRGRRGQATCQPPLIAKSVLFGKGLSDESKRGEGNQTNA